VNPAYLLGPYRNRALVVASEVGRRILWVLLWVAVVAIAVTGGGVLAQLILWWATS
jgi:hypothetical protein